MSSKAREALENWLQTLDVKGRILDAGGFRLPVKGRTRSWQADDYKILDVKDGDYIFDLNNPLSIKEKFDVVFCLEVMQFVYNPLQVLKNLCLLLKKDGILYINFHFIFQQCKGTDYLRYTKLGIEKLLTETGFEIDEFFPRIENGIGVGYFVKCICKKSK